MGRKLERRDRKRHLISMVNDENGYLLISTLLFLIFSGLFSHSIIKISTHQIVQLRQYSSAYQAKGALNMSEELLYKYILENEDTPSSGRIKTSAGDIEMVKESDDKFIFKLTLKNGVQYFKETKVDVKSQDIDVEEENETIPKKDE